MIKQITDFPADENGIDFRLIELTNGSATFIARQGTTVLDQHDVSSITKIDDDNWIIAGPNFEYSFVA